MLEGIYRVQLKQKIPADWDKLDSEQRSSKLHEAVINHWAGNQGLLRKLGQARAASIKQYLVERGSLEDQRIYLLDVSVAPAEADGRVASVLQLGSQ